VTSCLGRRVPSESLIETRGCRIVHIVRVRAAPPEFVLEATRRHCATRGPHAPDLPFWTMDSGPRSVHLRDVVTRSQRSLRHRQRHAVNSC
jgi:hypothetical protein